MGPGTLLLPLPQWLSCPPTPQPRALQLKVWVRLGNLDQSLSLALLYGALVKYVLRPQVQSRPDCG